MLFIPNTFDQYLAKQVAIFKYLPFFTMVSQPPAAAQAINGTPATEKRLTGKICTQIWAKGQQMPQQRKLADPPIGFLGLSKSNLWDNGTNLTVRIDGYACSKILYDPMLTMLCF